MTGTNVMNRRHNHDILQHDYLGGTGIVKSKTSIAITGSSNRNHHGDIKTDKRHDRSARTSNSNSNLCVVTKSGGSGGPAGGGSGGTSGQITTGQRKNSRQRQRPSDSKAVSKNKPSKDDVTVESKNSPVPSVLPPISTHTIINSKNDDRSPRVLESSASNMPPSLSLAPTRLAIRQTTSPDIHGAMNSTHVNSHVTPNNNSKNNNNNNNNNNSHDHSIDGTSNAKHSSSLHNHGPKRNSLSRSDTNNCIRLPNNNTNNNNNNNYNDTNTSPPPRSPRLATENSRLSPINSQDKPKTKFEKKVLKSMVESSVPTSPRAYRLGSSDTPTHQQQQQGSNNASQNKTDVKQTSSQRKQSIKSLPKLTPTDEQFSIRRKIEQFRKWHEDQHADNLKRLPGEDTDEVFKNGATHNSRPSIPGLDPLVPTCSADVMDFAKLLEDKIIQNNLKDENKETADNSENKEESSNGNEKNNKNSRRVSYAPTKGKRGQSNNNRSKNRPVSGATWKTWRGINESDAYDDVNKYIHDNDLMDPEREEWIKSWIKDVGVAMSEMGDITIEV